MFSDFGSDDSVGDPTFNIQDQNSGKTSEDEINEVFDSVYECEPSSSAKERKKRGRKRACDKENWKKNVSKRLRNSGKAYEKNSKTKDKARPRQLQPPCTEKCRQKCALKICEDDRLDIFKYYWSLGDLVKQRHFISNATDTIKPKYRYVREGSHRDANNAYYFTVRNQKIRVCKLFFRNTLDINDSVIKTVTKKKKQSHGAAMEDLRGRHGKHSKIDENIKNNVRNFIEKYPKVESHYRRSESGRHYVEGNKFIADLHREFEKQCQSNKSPSCKYGMFFKIFTAEFNIHPYLPKNDQCNECVTFENSSPEEKIERKDFHDKHLVEKDLARAEKNSDKEKLASASNVVLAVYDLAAVFQCPKGNASIFFYKSKLNVFNFSIYNMLKKNATCFVWHEGLGKRGVNELGTCVYKYLEEVAPHDGEEKEIIFYSDNCPGQQKNQYMFCLYLYAVQNLNISSITHKFLIQGHTQNEGDSVHSTIEKEIKKQLRSGPMYTSDALISSIRAAKKKGDPYKVVEMYWDDFFDIHDLTNQMRFQLRPLHGNQSVKISDIKVVKAEKSSPSSLFVKTSFHEQQYQELLITRNCSRNSSNIIMKKAFSARPGIPVHKKKDLMDLIKCNAIPRYYSEFYDNL